MNIFLLRFSVTLMILMLVSACGGNPSQPAPTFTPAAPSAPAPSKSAEPPTPLPPTETSIPRPPVPERVAFTTEDGKELEGMYYATAIQPSPVVVLVHWIGSDRHDWDAIAPWIQGGDPFAPPANLDTKKLPFLDPAWFPVYPSDLNVAVFSFTLRGCKFFPDGCSGIDESGWLKDVNAAMKTIATLPGVDPNRVITMGASIGADGALDGCYLYNKVGVGKCIGSFPLSPGSFLTMNYKLTATQLDQEFPNAQVWCFDATGENECKGVTTVNHTAFQSTGEHGMFMIKPDVEPKTLEKFIEFMQLMLVQ